MDKQDGKGATSGEEVHAASPVNANVTQRNEAISFYWEDRRVVRKLAQHSNDIKTGSTLPPGRPPVSG
jgi:hypothetical protein